jgi:hypothetical protein
MSPEVTVLLALLTTAMGIGIPLIVKEFKELRGRLEKANDQSHKISNRQTIVETKLDMLLDHEGFDIHKVNKAIKEHKEELEEMQENGRPSVGCINVKELYKEVP